MALLPTHNFYPRTNNFIESFNSSVSKFPVTTRLQFLRYAYHTIPFKKPFFYAANSSTTDSASTPQQNPPKRSKFYRADKSKAMGLASESPISKGQAGNMSLSRNSWFDKWNETNQQDKLKGPQPVVDYSGEISGSDSEESSTDSTMERIVQKLKRFGIVDNVGEKKDNADRVIEKGSVEDIFRIEEGILPNPRGGFSEKSPFGDDNVFSRNGEVRFPWEKPEVSAEEEGYSVRQKSRTSLAELTLPESELNRLKRLTFKLKNKTKIGGAGVTQEIVEKIHEKWKASEVVRLKIEGAPALNMKRMHEILERKTGGLVVWRSGTSVSLYRGVGYKVQSEKLQKRTYNKNDVPDHLSLIASDTNSDKLPEISETKPDQFAPQVESTSDGTGSTEIESKPEVKYEDEIEKLLDGLGPRYTDWPGPGPLPVDADLLPGHLPGYKPPFRILPYGVRSTLGTKEATALRRLARVIPPHFALGRSRQHQGLAAAMIKLWERSSIAKIALKRGVQLTTSERMAEDIKKLTGCIMLSRNKDFLVFYRGKNFLSPEVAEVLMEKESLAKAWQDEEEQARLRACAFVTQDVAVREESGIAGTLGETLDADAKWGKRLDNEHKQKVMRDADMLRHANLVRRLERKLTFVERKIVKAERALSKVEQSLNPAESVANEGSLTDEERFMFRKLGLKMKAFLLLGRRGVFDGTVENMHLHWKYRELVKIMVKAKNFEQVKSIALSLEAESRGVLVSVDKVSKGYAIIVFRGKDYSRPSVLRPKNLLTKRKALARSIELQRHEALVRHISALQARVDQLRSEIDEMAEVNGHGDEELYNRIDSAYPAEDEESEEEADHGYEELYNRIDSAYPTENEENEEGGDHGDEELYDRIVSAYPTFNEESEEEEDDAYPEIYDSDDSLDENDGLISNHHLQVDDDLLDESEEYISNRHQLNFSDETEGALEIKPELS